MTCQVTVSAWRHCEKDEGTPALIPSPAPQLDPVAPLVVGWALHFCFVSHLRIFFSFLYLKKIKISKIYGGFEKFQNYTPVAPCLGDRGPVALWLGDRT